MRIGIHAGIKAKSDNAIDDLVAAARETHEQGLDFWVPQLTDVDALTALAVVGHAVPGLALGTAVVPTYPRHPLTMAMQALTVQAASGNHLTLGIGLSHQIVIEGAFGMSYDKPVRHMREYLSILMPALHSGQVNFEGDTLTARTFAPVRVPGASAPSVVVAALGAQMLRVTGELADGTALWMVGPRTIEDHIVPTISAAASAAGRPAPQIVVGLPVSVTVDPAAARERAATQFGFYNNLPSYRAMLDKEGAEGPADVAVVGDEETVAAAIHHLGSIGATSLSLPVFGNREERDRTIALLQSLSS